MFDPGTNDPLTDAFETSFRELYVTETNFASQAPFLAVVEDIRDGPPDATSWSAYEARDSNFSGVDIPYTILARVKLFDFLPQITEYGDGYRKRCRSSQGSSPNPPEEARYSYCPAMLLPGRDMRTQATQYT